MSVGSQLLAEAPSRWDRLGIWASAACMVHCLVAPLLFLAAPAFAGIWAHPASHALIALFVLPAAATVLRAGRGLARPRWISGTVVLGAALILVGCALPYMGGSAVHAAGACADCCPQLLEGADGGLSLSWPPASIVTVLGSLCLVSGHVGNLLHGRACCGPGA